MPNVASTIDGSHIPLAEKLSLSDTTVPADFYCAQNEFNSVILQVVCNANKLLLNICCNMFGNIADGGVLWFSSLYDMFCACEILKEPVVCITNILDLFAI